jgi:sphinganine-1-phosphate aldolase
MQHVGQDGYLRLTEIARRSTLRLREQLEAIPGVEVLGDTPTTLIAFRFTDIDTFAVADELARQGWYCDRQGPPDSLHCTVHAGHEHTVDQFAGAVADGAAAVRTQPAAAGEAGAYGTVD